MADTGRMLRVQAKGQGVPLWVIEKDYALSYVLAGIANTLDLGDRIVLKGGTALKKAYFPHYRFSEDLDYSTVTARPLLDVDQLMSSAIQRIENNLQEKGSFLVQMEPLVLREPHPGGQVAYTIRVQFPYHRQPLCRVKIEISVDEPVLLAPENRAILHEYPEPFSETVGVYPLAEILAEKLRALLQSYERLQTRGWGASRVCRDYYDIWQLLNRADFSDADIPELTEKKCAIKGIDIPGAGIFFLPVLQNAAKRAWTQMLTPFVPDCPKPDRVFTEAQQGIYQLWQSNG
jgi:predicted nucleotidyltransferase component of viral defense system